MYKMTPKTTLRCSRVRCWTGRSSPAAARCSPVQRTSVKHTVVGIPRHTFPSHTTGTDVARHVCAGVQIMLSVSARLSKKQGINTARRGQQEAHWQGNSRRGGKQPWGVLGETCASIKQCVCHHDIICVCVCVYTSKGLGCTEGYATKQVQQSQASLWELARQRKVIISCPC